ncbi:toll/interleukin-1 receptor domain-containing protein, partial [Frankia sp. QA3]|uniref:toll/interleukin-1 receptor domain-containing protein n=1 Tax=Frankia sp. QA3 TaxID=710111 RepID=UPI000269C522
MLSYARADSAWAEWIAWHLEEAGYNLLASWNFASGDGWNRAFRESLREGREVVVLLSRAYLRSLHGQDEWQATGNMATGGRRLVFRLDDCGGPEIPASPDTLDLFGLPEDAAREGVLRLAGRAGPAAAAAGAPTASTGADGGADG